MNLEFLKTTGDQIAKHAAIRVWHFPNIGIMMIRNINNYENKPDKHFCVYRYKTFDLCIIILIYVQFTSACL